MSMSGMRLVLKKGLKEERKRTENIEEGRVSWDHSHSVMIIQGEFSMD